MTSDISSESRANGQSLAAIDLGSNSFHMIVARVVENQLVVVDRMKEMVQLGTGLDAQMRLDPEVQERALACLERFGQRVRGLPQDSVRVVGTNTLRTARDAEAFLERAEEALGHPIDVISGIEEARLIYLGVAHSLGAGRQRLVVDIGGGSTELVIGQGMVPLEMESLYVGCITTMKQHFPDGKLTAKRFRRAEVAALQEIGSAQARFKKLGWETSIGASGTARAVAAILKDAGWSRRGITREGLSRLRGALIACGDIQGIRFAGVGPSRAAVLPGGVAVLAAVFEALGIEEMQTSDTALREGLLDDLLGRVRHQDVRTLTVESLMDRYHVEREKAQRVETTALELLQQVAGAWDLPLRRSTELISWAARLHEIGMDIAHGGYHKHGAYVLDQSDLPGFSRQEQHLLAVLVRAHRRRFPVALFKALPNKARVAEHLAILLRLAVLLHRGQVETPSLTLIPGRRSLTLEFAPNWLQAHPLTQADLQQEAEWLRAADFQLLCPNAR